MIRLIIIKLSYPIVTGLPFVQAADNSRSVAEDMVDLNGHADATFAASNEVLETTKRLFDHTRGVQSNVDSFLRHVRIA